MPNDPLQCSSHVETSTLAWLAETNPLLLMATQSDEELAAMARHLLPDMAAELLALRGKKNTHPAPPPGAETRGQKSPPPTAARAFNGGYGS